jgi:hypothetical protein
VELWQVLLFGAIGGAVPDLTRIAKAGAVTQTVIISLVALVILGAIASLAANAVTAGTVISSLTAGYAGPELLSRLFAGTPPATGRRAAADSGLQAWWAS